MALDFKVQNVDLGLSSGIFFYSLVPCQRWGSTVLGGWRGSSEGSENFLVTSELANLKGQVLSTTPAGKGPNHQTLSSQSTKPWKLRKFCRKSKYWPSTLLYGAHAVSVLSERLLSTYFSHLMHLHKTWEIVQLCKDFNKWLNKQIWDCAQRENMSWINEMKLQEI